MLVAAHTEVEDDLPRQPSAERWEVLLKMVEDERDRFTKERLKLLAEMEQHRNDDSSYPPSPSGQGNGDDSGGPPFRRDGGGNVKNISGSGNADGEAWGAVKGRAQAYYLHLHFDYPGCSTPPLTLFKITSDALKARLLPSRLARPSRPHSFARERHRMG
ncbi:hypothetical protein K438DRAFT_638789 [Mycena galopus ATCC 62051]|nr:hypothetical protein K438DRAFT_638789 [Mycena galopus ATCC 62051]